MPHAFSVEIHDYLSLKIASAEKGKTNADQQNDRDLQSYYEGQLLELKKMRSYLTENIDLKTQRYY